METVLYLSDRDYQTLSYLEDIRAQHSSEVAGMAAADYLETQQHDTDGYQPSCHK